MCRWKTSAVPSGDGRPWGAGGGGRQSSVGPHLQWGQGRMPSRGTVADTGAVGVGAAAREEDGDEGWRRAAMVVQRTMRWWWWHETACRPRWGRTMRQGARPWRWRGGADHNQNSGGTCRIVAQPRLQCVGRTPFAVVLFGGHPLSGERSRFVAHFCARHEECAAPFAVWTMNMSCSRPAVLPKSGRPVNSDSRLCWETSWGRSSFLQQRVMTSNAFWKSWGLH